MAVLEGDAVVYVAQVPSAHAMRMFTEVGRRVYAHSTGVGKALLSQLPDERVLALLRRTGMPARTPRTRTHPAALLAELAEVRAQGWAIDNAEQENGVCCLAVPVPGAPMLAAVSVSGPSGRVTTTRIPEIVPRLRAAAAGLCADLHGDAPLITPED